MASADAEELAYWHALYVLEAEEHRDAEAAARVKAQAESLRHQANGGK